MNEMSVNSLTTLGVASLCVIVSGMLVHVALRLTHCRSPKLRQLAWTVVIVQGILWLPASWRYTVSAVAPTYNATTWNLDAERNSARSVEIASAPEREEAMVTVSTPRNDNMLISESSDPSRVHASSIPWEACMITALIVWLSGMLLILVRRTRDYFRFVRQSNLTKNDNPDWRDELTSLCQQLGIRQPIQLFCSDSIGPAFCRWPSEYRIVVPFSLWQQLTKPERKSILRHELGHFQRGDLYWSLAMHVVALPHWFNPMTWFALRQIENNMELACDDLVRLSRDDLDVATYAKALLTLGQCSSRASMGVAALDGACLAERIRRLLAPFNSRDPRAKQVLILCMLVALCLTNLVRVRLLAQQPPDSKGTIKSPAAVGKAVSDKEVNDAILDLRSLGGFVREFHPRDAEEYWIQIILEGDSKKSGFAFEKLPNAPKDPTFDDDAMEIVRVLCLSGRAHVHLRHCQFTEAGLAHLAGTKVERLELNGSNINDQHLESLPKMMEMRELSIANSSITEAGFDSLSKCNQLESLDFARHPNISSPTSSLLARLPKLKRISLNLTLDDVEHLNKFEQLESLSVQLKDSAAVSAFAELRSLGPLRELTISGKLTTSELIVFVTKQSPKLEKWYLRDCQDMTPEAAIAISSLSGLKVLSLDSTNVTDEHVKLLMPLTKLTWLDLAHTAVTDESLKVIGRFSDMRFLGLSQTNVSEAGLANLKELHNLFHLDLQGTYVKSVPDWLQSREKLQVSFDGPKTIGGPQKQAAKEKSSLDRAVDEFNKRAGKNPIGKFEPPLTSDEVVAAIRGWDRASVPIDDEKFALFEQIAATGQLPPGAKLSSNTNWVTRGFNYQVWWIDLDVMTDVNQGYTFRIRSRILSSQKIDR